MKLYLMRKSETTWLTYFQKQHKILLSKYFYTKIKQHQILLSLFSTHCSDSVCFHHQIMAWQKNCASINLSQVWAHFSDMLLCWQTTCLRCDLHLSDFSWQTICLRCEHTYQTCAMAISQTSSNFFRSTLILITLNICSSSVKFFMASLDVCCLDDMFIYYPFLVSFLLFSRNMWCW